MVKWIEHGMLRTLSIILFGLTISSYLTAQTKFGILPVAISPELQSLVNESECQLLASEINEALLLEFSAIGGVTKLSREHILLLTKELPSSDPGLLYEEAYRAISSKEHLQYLVQGSTGNISIQGKTVIASLRITVIDGINGKVFWDRQWTEQREVSGKIITGKILMNEVYKSALYELTKEIKSLKF